MKLSIVIPCYNDTKTIRAIVDRDRAAPVADKEIIIVDDCSRDGTRDILRNEIAPLVTGATVVDGLWMLIHQARHQQKLWFGEFSDAPAMRLAAERELSARRK